MKISFVFNNTRTVIDVEPDRRVVDILREDLQLTGTKEGCGSGECGACSILVDGESRLSCLMLAAQLEGKSVVTIEGVVAGATGLNPPSPPFDKGGNQGGLNYNRMHPIQEAFVEHGAVQCGFCTPGMVVAAADLLNRNAEPTRNEIREAISGNLCRCTGYQKIVDAVEAAAKTMKNEALRVKNDGEG
jgi:aerobic carbon-monoxide dehydrogenase small subunit